MAKVFSTYVNLRKHPHFQWPGRGKVIRANNIPPVSTPARSRWTWATFRRSSTSSASSSATNAPPQIFDPTKIQSSIGDLHGNALKLMFFLLHQGAATMSEADYDALVEIYDKDYLNLSVEDTKAEIVKFNALLQRVTMVPGAKIRLLGDELADRGKSDYFTLKIIEKMITGGTDLEIIMSNHSLEFLLRKEWAKSNNKPFGEQEDVTMDGPQVNSADTLQYWLRKNIVSENEVDRACQLYLSKVKFISTDVDRSGELNFFNHAPIWNSPSNVVKELVMTLRNSGYSKKTAPALKSNLSRPELLTLIDEINTTTSQVIKDNHLWDLLCRRSNGQVVKKTSDIPKKSPFYKIVWHRPEDNDQYPEKEEGINTFCGHESTVGDQTTSVNNQLGYEGGYGYNPVGEMEVVISNSIEFAEEYILPNKLVPQNNNNNAIGINP